MPILTPPYPKAKLPYRETTASVPHRKKPVPENKITVPGIKSISDMSLVFSRLPAAGCFVTDLDMFLTISHQQLVRPPEAPLF
jgi:hypothetical protein